MRPSSQTRNFANEENKDANKPILQASRDKTTRQVAVMSEHDRTVYFNSSRPSSTTCAPGGVVELHLARRIGQDNWRLNRLHAIEENIFAWGHSGPYKDIEAEHPQIHHAFIQALSFMDDRSFSL